MIKLAVLLPDKAVWQELESPGEFPTDPRSHETQQPAHAHRVLSSYYWKGKQQEDYNIIFLLA